jgi:hypothetical protein
MKKATLRNSYKRAVFSKWHNTLELVCKPNSPLKLCVRMKKCFLASSFEKNPFSQRHHTEFITTYNVQIWRKEQIFFCRQGGIKMEFLLEVTGKVLEKSRVLFYYISLREVPFTTQSKFNWHPPPPDHAHELMHIAHSFSSSPSSFHLTLN